VKTPTDPKSALAQSVAFLRGHELIALARELPAALDLPLEAHARFEQALSEGFDAGFFFPPVAAQKIHFDALLKQMAAAPAFGLARSDQYTAPSVPEFHNLKTASSRNRPGGPYLLMYRTAPFPRETREKSPPDLDKLFAAMGWNGLTVAEYLVLQRLLCEKNLDHRFDLYAPDAARSQWQWLLDTRLPSGVVMAFWNPKLCRLEIGPAPPGVNTARRGAHPTVVIPTV